MFVNSIYIWYNKNMDKNLWEHGYEYYAGDGSETLNL